MENMFTQQEIEVAKGYKYNGTDDSICVKLFLRKFWNWCIEFVPLNIAPNVITFVGFLFEIFSFLFSAICSRGFIIPLPGWCCLCNGISLFIYQTLDNLDGRQARRTQMSSPLGQFFDHGCDAITGVLEMMKVGASLNLACNRFMFYLTFLMAIGFFFTSWQEYVTHAFYLGPINGPDEGLLFLMIIHLLCAIVPNVNSITKIPLFEILFYIALLVTIGAIVYDVVKKTTQDSNLLRPAILSLIPFLVTIILFCLNYFGVSGNVSASFIFAAGLLPQFQGQQLIVGHLVGRDSWKQIDLSMWCLWVLAVIPLFLDSYSASYWTFYSFVLLCAVIFFDVRVINGLSTGLNIPVFTVHNHDNDIDNQNAQIDVLEMDEMEDNDDENENENGGENKQETNEVNTL